jgi:hypothetical protein
MAGPSGAGMVQAYLRMSRSGAQSRRREYLTALRRETAKYERPLDLVEFDCFFLCMACGHLSEPRVGDPMRTDAQVGAQRCAMCSSPGLVDLRQNPMVHSLCELEANDINHSRLGTAARYLGVIGLVGGLVGLLYWATTTNYEAEFLFALIFLVGGLLVTKAAVSLRGRSTPRALPRRWRMPRTAKLPGAQAQRRVSGSVESDAELLRAPLSGRPCVAYEVAVRDDAKPTGSHASWRLIEQDNVDFSIGELEVAAGDGQLELRRELLAHGTIGSQGESTRRYLRMRGLLDSEDVYIYETVLEPGDVCAVSRRKADAPVLVRG